VDSLKDREQATKWHPGKFIIGRLTGNVDQVSFSMHT